MLTEKQLAANRANAQLSTGPKSEEGKRRSSLNARRHNLTGQVTAMTDEDRIAHDALAAALIKSMAPEGALELQLAQRIATDSWRLNRSSAIEENIFALGLFDHSGDIVADHPEVHTALTAARTFTREAKSIGLLTLYEQRINRSLQKNLAVLQQLQATRKAEAKHSSELLELSEMNNLPEQPAKSSAAGRTGVSPACGSNSNEDGFVFSNDQIHPVTDCETHAEQPEIAEQAQQAA
jgi:hypothetical protein